ncbi:hypothetical protein [Bosea sp. BK604]|uniref:hypothetical protein n=1 Tax=Bosea sp. BK604 TaxID=2512180 RepID=UPI00104A721F|nr:hypothetical protein [Bosea sp. BK604]
MELYSKDEGSSHIEVVVPETTAAPQAERRIRHAVETLAIIEDRSAIDVSAAIAGLGFDALRERLPADFRNTILLPVAETVVTRNRRLLHAAAQAEFAKTEVNRSRSAADLFVERCRFGHTFKGSFGFSIHSPIGPRPAEMIADQEADPPAERLIVQRVMRGLASISDTLSSKRLAVLSDPSVGFDADMLDNLAGLLEGVRSEALTFEFELSAEWPPDVDLDLHSTFVVATSIAPTVRELAAKLRETVLPSASVIRGFVTKLANADNPADLENQKGSREVTIAWEATDHMLPVRVLLSPADYRVAWRAHGLHVPVEVEGEIERAGRGFIIRRSKMLTSIPE